MAQVEVQLLHHNAPKRSTQANGGEDRPPLASCGRHLRPACTWLDGVVVSSAVVDNPVVRAAMVWDFDGFHVVHGPLDSN